jgi:L,D-peptidoglycan transpeptidase YkuD (ErfK/YbiS/YcfS/YnhG family)
MAIDMSNNIVVKSSGGLFWRNKEYKCSFGKNEVTAEKREGDGKTPIGCFPIREIFYRSDRISKPDSVFPTKELSPDDGWCDDPDDPNYNKHVKLPYAASHENLWRKDNLYDVIVVLGYNDDPPAPGKGSAIFMHAARPNYSPTVGCIALSLSDILELLKGLNADSKICVWNI